MDPHLLINQMTRSPLPAPFWFVELFKVLGFVLHMVPMNLWFAGLAVALVLHGWGSAEGKRFATRLSLQMPVIVAMGINFGIVPLLFLQLAYHDVFYPATILMAWFWLGIIALLIPAYYGVYIYSRGMREPEAALPLWRCDGLAGGALLHRHQFPVCQRPEPHDAGAGLGPVVDRSQRVRRGAGHRPESSPIRCSGRAGC